MLKKSEFQMCIFLNISRLEAGRIENLEFKICYPDIAFCTPNTVISPFVEADTLQSGMQPLL